MTIFQAVILGIVQGLTEFIPVSSSGHLYLLKWLFHWDLIPESYEIALHAGTLLVLLIYFFKDWIRLLIGAYQQTFQKEKNAEGTIFWYLVIATIPSGLIGYLLDKTFENALTKPVIIACSLIFMGLILYFIDKKAKSETDFEHLSFKQSFLIGMSQILAFIPGFSRSGVTITTARALGVTREASAKYSFMLSAPIVFGATVLKLKDFKTLFELGFGSEFIIGVLCSFLVGLLVINFMMNYIKKGSFKPFAIYRVVIGALVLLKIFCL